MKAKIAFLSAGLGHIYRGFEISANTWFHAINKNASISPTLYAGGQANNATSVWNLPRNGKISKILKLARLINDGVRLEQISFSIGLLVHLLMSPPDVIWLQEATVGNMLLKYRNLFKLKYKIMFCDGAPMGHEFAKRFDYIIFLHKYAMADAIKSGINSQRCRTIPHLSLFPESYIDKKACRSHLSIDAGKFVILCVAAWNKHHKRIDYLIEEVSRLGNRNILLLLCGQPEQGSEQLEAMANELGIDVRWLTLRQRELSTAYGAADVFVLPSLHEGLGAVLIEAGAHSLPIICHPHEGGKFILGENYSGFTNLSVNGNLSDKLGEYYQSEKLREKGIETEKIILSKFDQTKLLSDLVDFITYAKTDTSI